MSNKSNNTPLKAVTQKTGLSAHVIRAWEKRYGVIRPQRTETNRRYYSDEEIEKLNLLKKATDSGHSISSIAAFTLEDLQNLVLNEEKETIFHHKKLLPEKFGLIIKEKITSFFETAKDLNSSKLLFLLREIEDEFSQSIIIEEIILPVLAKLSEERNSNSISKSTENFIINELSYYLTQIVKNIPEFDEFPLILCYAPTGGFSQIGSLITAAAAKAEKWRVFNLGENISSVEIGEVINKLEPKVISINLIYPFIKPEEIRGELIELKNQIPDRIKIILSGRPVWSYRDEVLKIGGIFAGDTFALRKELKKIRELI